MFDGPPAGSEGDVEVRELDLDALASVRGFAAKLAVDHPAIDLLVNNAGVVLLGPRRTSADGFELFDHPQERALGLGRPDVGA